MQDDAVAICRRPRAAGAVAVSACGSVVQAASGGDQRVLALRGVDWDVYAGQMSLIVGPSGCGKTTLLSVIAGILDCDEGDVTIFGTKSRHGATARRRVSGQEHRLCLPAVQPPAGADGRRKRGDPAGDRRLVASKAVERAGEVLDSIGMGEEDSRACPASSPAARCSGSRSPGPWCTSPAARLRRADRRARPRDRPYRDGTAARRPPSGPIAPWSS